MKCIAEVDACYLRYKEKCSVNAVCDEESSEGPECICNDGYYGDGLNCVRINNPIGLLRYSYFLLLLLV